MICKSLTWKYILTKQKYINLQDRWKIIFCIEHKTLLYCIANMIYYLFSHHICSLSSRISYILKQIKFMYKICIKKIYLRKIYNTWGFPNFFFSCSVRQSDSIVKCDYFTFLFSSSFISKTPTIDSSLNFLDT